ncbi:S-adenosyl-L-methionine-dependentmethyltransferases superfamily protein [Striga asiatica]|uniref:Methyltransferase n=1 Tax=Striga asiatica TaxID=4170 RepID=A0A5A7QW46_STRAF|nr:S-adenosyl-L-methionine-dependentmethyltransferases superfamily protein [Striga asiatica]
MKAMTTSSPPPPSSAHAFAKIVAFSLLTLALLLFFRLFSLHPEAAQNLHLSFFNSAPSAAPSSPPPPPPPPMTKPPAAVVERTGIVNELGIMTEDFVVGEFDESLIESVVVDFNSSVGKGKSDGEDKKVVKVEKFRICEGIVSEYVPCLDNVGLITRFNSSVEGGNYERGCPEKVKVLDCLLPWPKGYKLHIAWPKSREELWFDNVPHTPLVGANGGQNWISKKGDKIILSGREPPYINGVNQYLDQISKMAPEIKFGQRTRVALDVGSGIASFGGYLMDRNVTTLSIDSKDVSNNQIQIALERGVPAMLGAFGKLRLPYPSQAFDLVHWARPGVNWTSEGGILLLEANRILRAGGYFVLAVSSVDKEMEDLTSKLCWELVNKKGYITIWQKPLNNSCYLNRDRYVQPSLCDPEDNPDDIWNATLKECITRLPENGYGANIASWPARLHSPPDRLFAIPMDAYKSRKDLYKADSKYWNDIVSGYINAFHIHKMNLRNVMDMKARYGGFAATLADFQVDSWVMNVVPVSGPNTLPVIFDRGLIGVMHDWCEPFNTYPRTYDLLNAAGLFSAEQKRTARSGIKVIAVSHLPSASRYFPSCIK